MKKEAHSGASVINQDAGCGRGLSHLYLCSLTVCTSCQPARRARHCRDLVQAFIRAGSALVWRLTHCQMDADFFLAYPKQAFSRGCGRSTNSHLRADGALFDHGIEYASSSSSSCFISAHLHVSTSHTATGSLTFFASIHGPTHRCA
jgi:hypothetical protein